MFIFFLDDENENQLMVESIHEIHVIFLLLVFYKRASVVRSFFKLNKMCLYYKVNFKKNQV